MPDNNVTNHQENPNNVRDTNVTIHQDDPNSL